MLFLKVLMWKHLTRYKIVLWYRFRQNENKNLLWCDFFALLPQKIILTSYVKRFSKKFCINSSLFCDFSDWKHVRTTATCKKKTFSSRKFLKTIFCYWWKIRSQSNDFITHSIILRQKKREYRLKSKFKYRNLYLPWFDFYKER